jgi:hypothetical protein
MMKKKQEKSSLTGSVILLYNSCANENDVDYKEYLAASELLTKEKIKFTSLSSDVNKPMLVHSKCAYTHSGISEIRDYITNVVGEKYGVRRHN